MTVDDKYRLVVSPKIRADFDNGKSYYEMTGAGLTVPRIGDLRPSLDALEWHRHNVYNG
jgi:putative restriction endonuclease